MVSEWKHAEVKVRSGYEVNYETVGAACETCGGGFEVGDWRYENDWGYVCSICAKSLAEAVEREEANG